MKRDDLSIILVDTETSLAHRLMRLFSDIRGLDVCREASMDGAVERFEHASYDILIITPTAFRAGEIHGVELLEVMSARSPETTVLFLGEPREIRIAKSSPNAERYRYATLPLSDGELRSTIEAIAGEKRADSTGQALRRAARMPRTEPLIGRSKPMRDINRQIRQAAATDIPVLLLGETGTGKDLVAQLIHERSASRTGPYVAVNLGAIPSDLVASELFGHEKGAFTGATDQYLGKFEQANEGTIFLDEVDTIDEKVQVALLRVIEEEKFERLGGEKTVSSSARIIAASNRDLGDVVHRGAFREDLYYRLDVFRIVMPLLKERHGDIPLLIDAFVKRYNRTFRKKISGIAPECINLLESYDWPGNVRELKNVCQRAVLVCRGEVILPDHLPPRFRPGWAQRPSVTFELGTPLAVVEREMVLHALAATKNNRKKAAELLGISRRALYNKLRKHGIG